MREKITIAIHESLTSDLLKKPYRGHHNKFYGHCYVASETLYHLLGGKDAGLKIYHGRDELGIVHWWLEDGEGIILDPTSRQYTDEGKVPPYDKKKRGTFLTQLPSKRAKILMERVEKKL
jgi:hypothetical protein